MRARQMSLFQRTNKQSRLTISPEAASAAGKGNCFKLYLWVESGGRRTNEIRATCDDSQMAAQPTPFCSGKSPFSVWQDQREIISPKILNGTWYPSHPTPSQNFGRPLLTDPKFGEWPDKARRKLLVPPLFPLTLSWERAVK